MPPDTELSLLGAMLRIRAFEAALMSREDHGFQLLSAGEEAVAVGVCAALEPRDRLLCSGRAIGPALARGVESGALMAELHGKTSGPCRGKGGRGHVAQPATGLFGAHAVVAGNLSIAAGVALALQQSGSGAIAACIFGDGACGAGALHETLNIAALWKLPLLLVCDNNGYSVSTPRAQALAPARLSDLAAPFGMPALTVEGSDVLAVREAAVALAGRVREGGGPAFLECVCERLSSHSSATRETRSTQAMSAARERCPIRTLARRLQANGALSQSELERLEVAAREEAAAALRFSDASPYPDSSEAVTDVA
jgi:pyruvate dehydrogenase E1 component alpha subunit